MSLNQTYHALNEAEGGQGSARDYFELLKPRVMSLVIFTAIVGLFAAPVHIHPWFGFITILCISMGAGASGALNMWYDADIDAVMQRTMKRPVPSGSILPSEAFGFGLVLSLLSVAMLGLFVNMQSAALLAFTIFFYVVIYTMGLKRRTSQNIVIGGAAGAFPPMISWVAATGRIDLGAIALFLLIFVWTPPHFWALALWREGDYHKAGVPMLPNVHGRAETRKQILIYALLCIPVAALPAMVGVAGWLYTVGAAAMTLVFVAKAVKLYRLGENDLNNKVAKGLFGFSIIWLFALFALILVEKILGLAAFAGVF
ncbi:heme o synthase [Aestuariivirga litoralis]|uniref:heme o synthase n=1 Tax=Aestuariivirga litoralis TaxID=2650924 RepID=UPI0018C6425E|nr:heme o synthase [Aestuariivirga litoralis]MBG1233422.1 protoheme IX farnesyltransferase [Aestuariivirga litoralis]